MIKSEISNCEPVEITYPFLGKIDKDCIFTSKIFHFVVLFSRETVGTVVYVFDDNTSHFKIGDQLSSCVMKEFIPFKGRIILSNKGV